MDGGEEPPLRKNTSNFCIVTQYQRGGGGEGGQKGGKRKKETPVVYESSRAGSIFPKKTMVSTKELEMMELLRITVQVKEEMDERVKRSLSNGKVIEVLFAFTLIGNRYTLVENVPEFERSGTHDFVKKTRQAISADQLWLDLEEFPNTYKSLVSILRYLKSGYAIPIHTIMVRTECSVAQTTGKDGFWAFLFEKPQQGYYYKLYIDFTQTNFIQ